MRARTIALTAVPVLLGGLGLAVVAGGVDPLGPFIPASEDIPIGPSSTAVAGSQGVDTGTAVDGRRPHLSVIDGRANLFLPTPLPVILSLLPRTAADLAPLPSEPTTRGTSPPVDTGSLGSQDTPTAAPAPTARYQPAPPASRTAAPLVGGGSSAASSWTPEVPASTPPASDPLPPRTIRDPRFDSDLLDTITGEIMNHAQPVLAGIRGPDPHADEAGPPDNAATGQRSDRTGTPGRPDQPGGGAQNTDVSRPGTR